MSENMLFLSNSIDDPKNDIIGFDTYVGKLDNAINAGAQLIAVTSPFGSGKTSVIELLKRKRGRKFREKFLHVQMWSELNDCKFNNKACELHRNFLYQIGSSISPRKGTYINRRLSNNYGLLKLHVNRPVFWVAFIVSIFMAITGWVAKEHSDFVLKYVPKLKNIIDYLPPALFCVAIVLMVIIITCAEIIFSSKDSEKQREIEADEIIDLYRSEIIRKKGKILSFICNVLKRIPLVKKIPWLKGKNYIVIIEDLDRTDDGNAVIHFLKELRKYYLPINNDDSTYQNRVVFIVNIKPESILTQESKDKGKSKDINNEEDTLSNESVFEYRTQDQLYAKLFDYVLNLQTINIVDYETILCALLAENKEYLELHSLKTNTGKLSEIPGMQWMIRGENINIREIKKRLNRAFVIYETLKERFPDKGNDVDFEKCAVAAFLTTEYELEFSQTDDIAFGELIEQHIQRQLNRDSANFLLESDNMQYVEIICDLISSRLIGDDYRMYFYNYPKNSVMYSNDELSIQNAILYGSTCDKFEEVANRVIDSKSDVVQKSLNRLCQLKLPLPQTVIKTECLFLAAICYEYDSVLEMFGRINVNNATLDKNIANIVSVLKYDPLRKVYTKEMFEDFCLVWESVFEEDYLLQLREVLCSTLTSEVLLFKRLFFGEHSTITQKEMECIEFVDSLTLMNLDSKTFLLHM